RFDCDWSSDVCSSDLILSAVAPDRFDRATFHRLFAKIFFFGRLRLLVNERMTTVVVAFEIRRRSFAAQIAVDALLVDVEFAGGVFGILVGDVSHVFFAKGAGS